MRAVTVIPHEKDSLELLDVAEPPEGDGPVLVATRAIGICGTDHEIVDGEYGSAPAGAERLIVGHESLARVLDAPAGSDLRADDLVVGIVRRKDPVPCAACAAGDWDMCRNGGFTERGIKDRHGFASERFRTHPEHLVKVDPALGQLGVLLEPTSVVAKAWEHIEHIGRRATWRPSKVLITGAGPIGLLAALLSVQRGLETHVYDRTTEGHKPEMVAGLGAHYHFEQLPQVLSESDIVIECTGAVQLLLDTDDHTANRITCLLGVSPSGISSAVDMGFLNRRIVLHNGTLFGSVNANRRHYERAATALAAADHAWLGGLLTRRVPLADWREAYLRRPDDIKTTLHFEE
jgi:threonine dehydrogenase-like Zn-dependent dehydrogenase